MTDGSPGDDRMRGKHAIVSGGARGQGAAHCRVLARHGARVLMCDILDEEGSAAAAAMRAEGLDVTYQHLDVTVPADWEAAVALAEELFGSLNVLINNAGVASFGNAVDESVEGWSDVVAINQTSVFLGIKHSVPAMRRAGGGSIVNIGSPSSTHGDEGQIAYCATKGAIASMTKAAALDHVNENIRVNNLIPGLVLTHKIRQLEGYPEILDVYLDRIPMHRDGQPEEIAYAAMFLAGDESSYVTGVSLQVDGGISIGLQAPVSAGAAWPPASRR